MARGPTTPRAGDATGGEEGGAEPAGVPKGPWRGGRVGRYRRRGRGTVSVVLLVVGVVAEAEMDQCLLPHRHNPTREEPSGPSPDRSSHHRPAEPTRHWFSRNWLSRTVEPGHQGVTTVVTAGPVRPVVGTTRRAHPDVDQFQAQFVHRHPDGRGQVKGW